MKQSPMRPSLWLALALALPSAALAAQAATPAVTVTYDHPDKFTETREVRALAPMRTSDDYLDTLKAYLQKRATAMLAPGQQLDVVITDIDRAGSFEPWRTSGLHDVRIIKDIYPPRIDLHFRLLGADGAVVREGTRTLRDPGFLTGDPGIRNNDALRYEKRLIDRWLRLGPDKL